MAGESGRSGGRSIDEFDGDPVWDDAGFIAAVEEELDGLATAGAVVEGEVVDVHADELVGLRAGQVAGELHGVSQRRVAVVEAKLDARVNVAADASHQLRAEVFAHDVAAERKRERGLGVPPFAEVDDFVPD